MYIGQSSVFYPCFRFISATNTDPTKHIPHLFFHVKAKQSKQKNQRMYVTNGNFARRLFKHNILLGFQMLGRSRLVWGWVPDMGSPAALPHFGCLQGWVPAGCLSSSLHPQFVFVQTFCVLPWLSRKAWVPLVVSQAVLLLCFQSICVASSVGFPASLAVFSNYVFSSQGPLVGIPGASDFYWNYLSFTSNLGASC